MKTRRLLFGVGVNDADYVVQRKETVGYVDGKRKRKLVWICAYYSRWRDMLRRCYDVKYQESCPTYKGCTVTDEWLTFGNFRAWMVTQEWEGMHLVKDLLFEGNKIYSPETCVFVTQTVNKFVCDSGNDRGEWRIGVCWDKQTEKFLSQCRNPFTKKQEKLGYFSTEQQAHGAWRKRKLELAEELAAIQTDPRVAEALISRYSK